MFTPIWQKNHSFTAYDSYLTKTLPPASIQDSNRRRGFFWVVNTSHTKQPFKSWLTRKPQSKHHQTFDDRIPQYNCLMMLQHQFWQNCMMLPRISKHQTIEMIEKNTLRSSNLQYIFFRENCPPNLHHPFVSRFFAPSMHPFPPWLQASPVVRLWIDWETPPWEPHNRWENRKLQVVPGGLFETKCSEKF